MTKEITLILGMLVQLAPNDIMNGPPITFMKGIEGIEKWAPSHSFVSQGTHITMQKKVHEPELWRKLGLVGAIAVIVGIASPTRLQRYRKQ